MNAQVIEAVIVYLEVRDANGTGYAGNGTGYQIDSDFE